MYGDDDQPVDGRHRRHDILEAREAVVYLPVATVPIGTDEDLWGDLAEPIDDAGGAEIRRAGGPDGADAGRREGGNHRLGHVGHVAGHVVTGLDPDVAERTSRS